MKTYEFALVASIIDPTSSWLTSSTQSVTTFPSTTSSPSLNRVSRTGIFKCSCALLQMRNGILSPRNKVYQSWQNEVQPMRQRTALSKWWNERTQTPLQDQKNSSSSSSSASSCSLSSSASGSTSVFLSWVSLSFVSASNFSGLAALLAYDSFGSDVSTATPFFIGRRDWYTAIALMPSLTAMKACNRSRHQSPQQSSCLMTGLLWGWW